MRGRGLHVSMFLRELRRHGVPHAGSGLSTHLEAHPALLAADAGQHEEDEGEEAREGDGHDSQG